MAEQEIPTQTSPAPAAPEPATPAHSSTVRSEIRSWARDLFIALALAVVFIIFLYQPVKVEGTSMTPLLHDQERIFINKFVYRFEPISRGDVVVFWYPLDRSKSFIKRVIALPGETVEIRSGQVVVNGAALKESYVPGRYADFTNYGPMLVPADHFFVMGDHRSSSNDSRVFGAVPGHYIYGKAVFAYWPVNRFGSLSSTMNSTVEAEDE